MVKSLLLLLLYSANLFGQVHMYTFEDLQALERSKSYEEFLNHARDIRPSKRDENWKEMVSNMATSYITDKSKKNEYNLNSFKFIESLFNWPTLRSDKLFEQLRSDFGLSFLSKCFEGQLYSKKVCKSYSQNFWHNSLDKIKVGSGLGLLYTKYNIRDYDLWNYYKYSINSPFSQYYCSRKDIQKILLERLSLEVTFEYETSSTEKKLSKLTNQSCISALTPIFKKLINSSNIVLSTLSFQVLRTYNRLSQRDSDLFLTKYILNNYNPGALYNLAWNNLHVLSLDYKRRKMIIEDLKKLDMLPGRVFDLKNLNKKVIIGKYISQKIPEYFDFYASTCIAYYEGSQDFPFGLPASNCDGFFELTKKHSLLSQELHIKYSGLKK